MADKVARVISVEVGAGGWEELSLMVHSVRPHCPHVTAEMMWIVTTCDPEDEHVPYGTLANRELQVEAGDMTQQMFMEAAERILREVRMQIHEHGWYEYTSSLRSSIPGRPGDSNAG